MNKNSSEKELQTIQEGIVSNTVKIMNEAELQKIRFESLQKLCESQVGKNDNISQPPNQSDPIVQPPVNEQTDINQLNDNTGLSSVQNHTLEADQSMEDAQSNKGKAVSTSSMISDPDPVSPKTSPKLKVKKHKK